MLIETKSKKEFALRFFFILFTVMFLTPVMEYVYVLTKPIETHPVHTEKFRIDDMGLYNEYKMNIEYCTWVFSGDYDVRITKDEYYSLTDDDNIQITSYLSMPYSIKYVRNIAIINCALEVINITIFIFINKKIKEITDNGQNN